jgi:Mrp family chromosome partitioning ATPase
LRSAAPDAALPPEARPRDRADELSGGSRRDTGLARPPNPTELFGTDRFRLLLAEARLEYDWVLVDSPPAASLADTTVLAAQVDMVLLVVRYNHADRDLTARVAQQLRNVNATIAGVVLNDVDVDRASHKDYYYAGYYYSSDESDESDEPGRRTRKTEKKVESGVGA